MFYSSLARRLLSKRKDEWNDYQIIERISACIRSCSDLNSVFNKVAGEIGRSLDLLHVAIALEGERRPKGVGIYYAPELSFDLKEEIRLLDGAISRDCLKATSPIEIHGPELKVKLTALFERSLEKPTASSEIKSVYGVPLLIDGEAAGLLLLYQRKARSLPDNEKRLAQIVASTLLLAIEHVQSEERAKIAVEREAITNRLLTAIRSAVGVDNILKVAVESLGAALGATRTVIYLNTPDTSASDTFKVELPKLVARAEYRESVLVPSLINSAIDFADNAMISQLMKGEIISISDTNESNSLIRAIGVRLGVRSLLLAPIAYNGQTVATLSIEQFDHPRQFTEDETRLVRLATEQLAVALYQAELYRDAAEAARREALLSKISSALHRSLDPEAVLKAIVEEVGTALRVCRSRLALLAEPMPEMIPVTHEYTAECCAARGDVLSAIQARDNQFLQKVLVSEGPVVASDPGNDPLFASVRKRVEAGSVKSIMTVAIRIGGKPIGIFSLHHCERKHSWTEWEIDLVKAVAEQAAVAIRQAELYREVRESATRASLVNQIIASIRRSLDLDEILQATVEELGRALGADRTYFRKVIASDNVVVAEYLSRPSLSVRHTSAPLSNRLSKYLVETNRTLVIDDVPAFILANPKLAEAVQVWQVEPMNLSQIICPIFVNDKFWGSLSISQTDHLRKWTAGEVALVESVAAQVEVAVSHSRLFEETKHSAEREALISHIIHGINQSNRLDEIFPIVATELGEHLAADSLLILKLDNETQEWRIECAFADGKVSKPGRAYKVQDFDTFASNEGDVLLCHDAENDPRMKSYLERFLRPAGTRAFMSVRLSFDNAPRLVIAAIMKSGPRRWTEDEVEIIRSAADQVFVAIQRAELFGQISQGKYEWEATFDALADGVFLFDRDGLVRRVNMAGALFEGLSIREMIGRRCCTLLQGIESEHCRVQEVLKTGRPVTFELVPEKMARPVLVTMTPFSDNSSGNGGSPLGAVCIVRDLSELKAAEASAREQRGFLVKLIEHATDAIFAISPEGRLIWFNEQLSKLSGYTRDELKGKGCWSFLAESEKDAAVALFYRALGGEAQTFEMRGLKKTGEARLLLVTYSPIYDEGNVTSVLSIARDITEERLASERAAQADKLRALGQLASGVAHNFNNILAAIVGHAQLVRRDFNDDGLLQRIDIIERAALDGAQTVKRIQAFGVQQNETAQDSVDVNQLVQDSANLTQARWCDEAQARGLHYEVDLDLRPVPRIRGSASELREVFVNIILNALDAMPQGGRIIISSELKGANVRVSFRDNGVGMNREVCDHIFEPFFTTKGVKGMGLGLAVSYSIIERHGGRIEARSNPGRGTTFSITIPVAETVSKKSERDHSGLIKKANVLVIDDDERVRMALAGMLNSAGHIAEQAANGREALEKMESGLFELVITDLSMPEMDGWAVASEIRRRWPTVKIILITGYSLPPDLVKHREDLVNEVVYKPIRFDDISATLNQVLQ